MFKIRTLDVDSSIQIRIQFPEQNKTKINRKVIRNFKKELQTLNSYTLSFKKQVLTHQEENDNNIAKTAGDLILTEKVCNDGITKET